jgi:hypothetical protein
VIELTDEKPCCGGDEPRETIDAGDPADENWLECIRWDGKEASLPLGALFPAGFMASSFVKRVVIADAESEEGVKEISPKEFDRDTMSLVDVVLNEKLIARTVDGRGGEGQFLFKPAGGGKPLTRTQWRDQMKTDAWKLQAIKELLIGTAGTKPFGIGMVR